jgi:hypothetical protein
MLQLLLKPLLGVAGQAVSGFVETKRIKQEAKLTEIQAKTKLRQQQISGEVSWEASAVDQMKGSWKDEFWTVIFWRNFNLLFPALDSTICKRGFYFS